MTTLYIIGILLLVICLVLIFFVSKSERIVNLAYKFNMCEKEINVFLNNKEDLVRSRGLGDVYKRQLNTEFKVFESVKNIKASKINNYDRDKLLSEAFLNIEKIYLDNPELKDIKSFDGIIKDIKKNEVKLVSLRTLYNKCSSEFNSIYNKFPYSIICKIKKMSVRTLYEGKELGDEIDKELNFVI